MDEVQFDESDSVLGTTQVVRRPVIAKKDLTSMLIKLGVVKNERQAFYILCTILVVAIILIIVTSLFFFKKTPQFTPQQVIQSTKI